jgi:hypothetical protein
MGRRGGGAGGVHPFRVREATCKAIAAAVRSFELTRPLGYTQPMALDRRLQTVAETKAFSADIDAMLSPAQRDEVIRDIAATPRRR